MDRPPPEDFDQYGAQVNYGVQNGNGVSKVVWWIMGGLMVVQAGIFLAGVSFVGSALYTMNARLAVVETKLGECHK